MRTSTCLRKYYLFCKELLWPGIQTGHWGLCESHMQEEVEAIALLPPWQLEPPQPWPVHSWGTVHWGFCSLNMSKMFDLNKAENQKLKTNLLYGGEKVLCFPDFILKHLFRLLYDFKPHSPKALNWIEA